MIFEVCDILTIRFARIVFSAKFIHFHERMQKESSRSSLKVDLKQRSRLHEKITEMMKNDKI